MRKISATSDLPIITDTETALMTVSEFIDFKNPEDKAHASTTYQYQVEDLNIDFTRESLGIFRSGNKEYELVKLGSGYYITPRSYGHTYFPEICAVIYRGVLYYGPKYKDLYKGVSRFKKIHAWNHNGDLKEVSIRGFKAIKYVDEYYAKLNPVRDVNVKRYPYILQQVTIKGQLFVLRSEKKPSPSNIDSQYNLAVLNPAGYVVGVAQDEWGATLIAVAKEYRGFGLGELLGEYWYRFNPNSISGGFTNSGQRNALKLWAKRVSLFLAQGWYSELVKSKTVTKQKVNAILTDYKKQGYKYKDPFKESISALQDRERSVLLVYSDLQSTIILYDSRFLDEQDPKYIYGHVHFVYTPDIGTYLYSIDYTPKYRVLTIKLALQLARDWGEPLYNGEGYRDLVDLKGVYGVVRKNKYIYPQTDYFNLKQFVGIERKLRKSVDTYDEKTSLLQEMAESKWN